MLSPVAEVSNMDNISVAGDDSINYLINMTSSNAASSCRAVSVADVAGNMLVLELNNSALYRLEIPSLCSTNLGFSCLCLI